MCGRDTLRTPSLELARLLGLDETPPFDPRYNIAPTQAVPAVRLDGNRRSLALLRQGLVPSWAADLAIGSRLINARSETVASKPSFRSAIKQRRCLIAADGLYEWQKANGRQPYLFGLRGGGPFAFAGLWEHWHEPGGEAVESCTILTTEANELVQPVHERMPVLLPPADYAAWLDPGSKPEALHGLLRPYPAGEMEVVPVGRWVNDPRHEGPRCLEAAG